MADDVDTSAEAVGGFLRWRRRHALPPGTRCYNCRTVLLGPWCYSCGQLGEDFHRSAHHLLFEAFESFFHADGRLLHTLPGLLLDPGELTRDYLDGKRAPQIPPMRLFLITLLVVFVAGDIAGLVHHTHFINFGKADEAKAIVGKMTVHVYKAWDAAISVWLKTHIGRAVDHPEALVAAMAEWAHRFAFVTLPISALMLSLIFMFRPGFVLFDHLIFSMHSLSFLGLTIAASILLNAAGVPWAGWLLALPPIHLFVHMRGTYRTGITSTLVRMFLLFTASTVAFSLLMLGLIAVSLAVLTA
jgi:hypothetical protein